MQTMWQGPPLVVMNNFGPAPGGGKQQQQQQQGGGQHLQLATTLFQSLFPAINVQVWRWGWREAKAGRQHAELLQLPA